MSENENEDENLEQPILEEDNLEIADDGYTPDYSYKFKDETRNFDERFTSAIKTKEDEDTLRDLYTRADGLDSYKDKYTGLEGKYGELETKSQSLVGGFETLQGLVDKKDMRGLAQALGLKNEDILDYSESLLDEEELPEKERQLVQQNREMTSRMAKMEQQMSGLNTQAASHDYNREKQEVETMIASEQFNPIAKGMEKMGLNVFDQVVSEGINMANSNGRNPTPIEVMNLVAKKYGMFAQQEEEIITNNDQLGGRQPTLPSVKGTAGSSVGKGPKSLADLYKLAESI